jgi:hypothetical protein
MEKPGQSRNDREETTFAKVVGGSVEKTGRSRRQPGTLFVEGS